MLVSGRIAGRCLTSSSAHSPSLMARRLPWSSPCSGRGLSARTADVSLLACPRNRKQPNVISYKPRRSAHPKLALYLAPFEHRLRVLATCHHAMVSLLRVARDRHHVGHSSAAPEPASIHATTGGDRSGGGWLRSNTVAASLVPRRRLQPNRAKSLLFLERCQPGCPTVTRCNSTRSDRQQASSSLSVFRWPRFGMPSYEVGGRQLVQSGAKLPEFRVGVFQPQHLAHSNAYEQRGLSGDL